MDIKDTIKKYALQNAIKYSGKANPGNLVGKLIQEDPKLKDKIKELMPEITKIVQEINKLSIEKQTELLIKLAPELLDKKEEKEHDMFGFLKLEPGQKVNSGFPPGPEKYPHIGHAKSVYVNYLLAKSHNGKFVLRFEDTNPKLVKKEFYEIMLDNFKWLGVKWDELVYASDYMDTFYKYAEQVINQSDAYMCSCATEQIKEGRAKGIPCKCREKTSAQNLKDWKTFFKDEQGSGILRLKIDLEHQNTTMRDPTIFRIIDLEHARHGKKYRVWPNYDFQNAIMDSINDIDIRVRTKEFEMRNELQRWIQNCLKIKKSRTHEYARFNIQGVESSGRVIREKVNNGELVGWDDPSLTTLVALRRRGFKPEALLEFVISTGFTKSESTLSWDDLILHNKRILDKECNRYFFVSDPVEIKIEGTPEHHVKLHLHSEFPERGNRDYITKDTFLISKQDFDNIKDNELVRLMDCVNFKKVGKKLTFHSRYYEDFKKAEGRKIIHFLPKQEGLIDIEVLMPDKKVVSGKTEPYIKNLKLNQVVQFERFGFCKLDKIETKDNKYMFWFTH